MESDEDTSNKVDAEEEDPFQLASVEKSKQEPRPEQIQKRNSIKNPRNSIGGSQGRASFGNQVRSNRREARYSQGSGATDSQRSSRRNIGGKKNVQFFGDPIFD